MNLSRAEATELAKGVAAATPGGNTDVLAVSYTHLTLPTTPYV